MASLLGQQLSCTSLSSSLPQLSSSTTTTSSPIKNQIGAKVVSVGTGISSFHSGVSRRKIVPECPGRKASRAVRQAARASRVAWASNSFAAVEASSESSATSTASEPSAALPGPLSCEEKFLVAAREGNLVPLCRRIFSDHLTPVVAYRCMVKEDERDAPSFLFESVDNTTNGSRSGRFSYLGVQPAMEMIARGREAWVVDHAKGTRKRIPDASDPLKIIEEISSNWRPVFSEELPKAFCGGWVGYTSYDSVRYVESRKLPFEKAPEDDRNLPDVHLSLYNDVIVFDHVSKVVYAVSWVHVDDHQSASDAYWAGISRLNSLVDRLQPCNAPVLPPGNIDMDLRRYGKASAESNMSRGEFENMVLSAKEHILAGDIFQIVLSQRFERRTFADPFEVYRALRVVNPSPYLAYIQTRGSILVASSPEILCRISGRNVVNRPLAGTRRRGKTEEEDKNLEADLLKDEKEVAEHVMLVDLGRNDVGKVSKAGSVVVEKLMEVERYSHVMHISSTVTGELLDDLTCWDALRAALPVGTVSGAPKVRAMELIDELEPTRRGPYSGGIGYVSFSGNMDFALALRTMVFPTSSSTRVDTLYSYRPKCRRQEWVVHLQAGAGIVADSNPASEFEETVNKSAALGRAIDLAEAAFLRDQ